jgi:hypothetical protein
MSPRVAQLQADIVRIIECQLEPLMVPGTKWTVIARQPDMDTADVLVTADSMDGIVGLLERSKARDASPAAAAQVETAPAQPVADKPTAEQVEALADELRNTHGIQGDVEEVIGVVWQAARAASPVPAGWKLVPLEPTPEMISKRAQGRVLQGYVGAAEKHDAALRAQYLEWLAASPAAPAQQPAKAVEFAQYMATSAEALLSALNNEDALRLRREESDDVPADDVYDASASRAECATHLRSAIYEFRKRAQPPTPQPPQGAQQESPPADPAFQLPPAYMLAKLAMVVPLLQEARDALCALREDQRVRHGIAKNLADRMDAAGTYSLDDWQAAQAPQEGETR